MSTPRFTNVTPEQAAMFRSLGYRIQHTELAMNTQIESQLDSRIENGEMIVFAGEHEYARWSADVVPRVELDQKSAWVMVGDKRVITSTIDARGYSPHNAEALAKLMKPAPVDIARARLWFQTLTAEERLAFLDEMECCRNCGTLDTDCQCDNDE